MSAFPRLILYLNLAEVLRPFFMLTESTLARCYGQRRAFLAKTFQQKPCMRVEIFREEASPGIHHNYKCSSCGVILQF